MHRRKPHLYSDSAWVSGEHENEHLCNVNVRQRAASAADAVSEQSGIVRAFVDASTPSVDPASA